MANLNYDTDKIIECLRRKVPSGANDEIIKAFFNSQKPAAIVNSYGERRKDETGKG